MTNAASACVEESAKGAAPRRHTVVELLIRTIALLVSFASLLVGQKGGIVEGRVVNSVTHAGIDGVAVLLNSKDTSYEATTDAAGGFRIAAVKPGEYGATLNKAGFLVPRGGFPPRIPPPVLLHSANESDDSWTTVGRGNFILDNLIADGKAVPMIVVMPNGHIDQTPPNSGAPASQRVEFAAFPNEFVSDIMLYIESHYRTIPDRPHRAIAGLSIGGAQTLNIAFGHLDWFSAIGVFSSGIPGDNVADWEKTHLAALGDPTVKKGLKAIWFSTGSEDTLIAVCKTSVAMLNKHGFAVTFEESTGAHTWVNWRNYLYEFAPRLFR